MRINAVHVPVEFFLLGVWILACFCTLCKNQNWAGPDSKGWVPKGGPWGRLGFLSDVARCLELAPKTWDAAYGEDMHEEYPGFIQRLSEETDKETDIKNLREQIKNDS